MKASTLNRLLPALTSPKMLLFERQLQAAFEEVLAEAAVRATSRFEAKAHPHTLRAALAADLAAAVVAAAPTPTSSMVAVYPSDEEAVSLAQLGGEPPEQIHCTLAFLGELAPDQAEAAAAVVQKVAREHGPMAGEVGGVACFADNGNGYPALVLPDVHRLAELRHAVCEALDAAGIPRMTNHGWTPHLTIAYGEELATPPQHLLRHPLTFGEVSFAQGDRRRDFELSNGRLASASFALGEALPEIFVVELADDTERAIAEVAAQYQPDEPGYGQTAWNAETGAVLWVSWDGSSNDEIDAIAQAMYEIDGVESFDYEAESVPDGWWEAKVVYPESPPRWVVEHSLTAAGPPADWTRPQPDELVDVDALIASFRTKADPIRVAAVAAVATPVLDRAGLSFDATNRFVAAVTGRTGQHIKSIADTTRLNVMRIVRTSYEAGLSIPDTAAAIAEGMAAAAPIRATLIARTELVGLVNGGSLAATRIVNDELQDLPAADGGGDGEPVYQKRWLTAPGASFPRHETYEGLDGTTVPLEGFFVVGSDQLQYPGDPDGSPDEVCNCRCTLIYVDAAGEETDAEVASALPSADAFEPGGDIVRVGRKNPESDLAVEPAAGPTVFVRIRPDLTEFRTELREIMEEAAADFPILDVRPVGSTPDVEIEQVEERTNAAQIPWTAVLAPEGKVTDDGRIFAPGSITWRDLPLSLMAMTVTSEGGHVGAELAGRIDRIWRDDTVTPTLIRAEGVFSASEYGAKIAALVGDRELRGNSVDLAVREMEIGPRSDYVDENGYWKADAVLGAERDAAEVLFEEEEPIMVFTDAVIGMSTVCPFPAFEEGEIMLASADETTPAFAIAADKTGLRLTVWLSDAVESGVEVVTASAAGYAPVTPPVDWFENPQFEELTPLTVTDDGRVLGHAWAWDVCHIGIPGTCTTAPSSETDYAYYLLKEVVADDGAVIPCGTITLGTGHAGRNLDGEAAAEHYDDTGTAVADVTIGEDEFGGWISGALRPDVPAARAREFRGSVLSGDWRRIGGNLELVGLLAVNVPGFPVPRAKALVAAADQDTMVLSLTAAGVVVPVEGAAISDRARLVALAARARGGLVALAELAAAPFEAPAPRSKPERLLAALTAAGEVVEGTSAPISTYELTQGSLALRKFFSAAIEAGYTEMTRASWPSEGELADAGEVLFRQGNDGVYRLPDGSIVFACVEQGWASFHVAAPSRAAGAEKLASFQVEYPPLYRQAAETTEVPITFWTLGQFGPQRRLRLIESASWEQIQGNYAGEVAEEISRLVSPEFEPGKNGQLLIWTGPPGTGKTWALRALATEWSDWAEFSFITDPDAFFVKDPSYMIDVLLHDAYESLSVDGDVITDGAAGEKWRILILEDTGELLSANAKQESGQGLSRLLNVVDGMVGQGLRVLAIVTTNDEIEGFHPAVTRPGRCASQIAFGALSATEAAAWLDAEVEEPMTLAELYAAAGAASDALAEDLAEADAELAAGETKPLSEVLAELDVPEREHPEDPEPEDARDLIAAAD